MDIESLNMAIDALNPDEAPPKRVISTHITVDHREKACEVPGILAGTEGIKG